MAALQAYRSLLSRCLEMLEHGDMRGVLEPIHDDRAMAVDPVCPEDDVERQLHDAALSAGRFEHVNHAAPAIVLRHQRDSSSIRTKTGSDKPVPGVGLSQSTR